MRGHDVGMEPASEKGGHGGETRVSTIPILVHVLAVEVGDEHQVQASSIWLDDNEQLVHRFVLIKIQ